MVNDAKAALMLEDNRLIAAAIARTQCTHASKIDIIAKMQVSKYWLAVDWRHIRPITLPSAIQRAYVTLGDGRGLHAQNRIPIGQLPQTASSANGSQWVKENLWPLDDAGQLELQSR